MKRILLVLSLVISTQAWAQDPNIFGTWYLYEFTADLGKSDFVADVQPRINPTLIINNNLEFEGVLACNDYFGTFSYDAVDDLLILDEYNVTLLNCDYTSHTNFEFLHNDSFSYTEYYYWVGGGQLVLEYAPGFGMVYSDTPLSVEERTRPSISVFPNPTSELLYVSTRNAAVSAVEVYSLSGALVTAPSPNNSALDVSALTAGIYFLRIQSSEGVLIEKFIKN